MLVIHFDLYPLSSFLLLFRFLFFTSFQIFNRRSLVLNSDFHPFFFYSLSFYTSLLVSHSVEGTQDLSYSSDTEEKGEELLEGFPKGEEPRGREGSLGRRVSSLLLNLLRN